MNGLLRYRLGCNACIYFIAFFAADIYLSIQDVLVQAWSGKALFRQMFTVFVWFIRVGHIRTWMTFLSVLLFTEFLEQALRIRP